jgi:hypothetical protein
MKRQNKVDKNKIEGYFVNTIDVEGILNNPVPLVFNQSYFISQNSQKKKTLHFGLPF